MIPFLLLNNCESGETLSPVYVLPAGDPSSSVLACGFPVFGVKSLFPFFNRKMKTSAIWCAGHRLIPGLVMRRLCLGDVWDPGARWPSASGAGIKH